LAESLHTHAQDLADYLNNNVLDHDEVTISDILDALASLGITLVEDPLIQVRKGTPPSSPSPVIHNIRL
jgi:hypothetical protein